MSDFDRVAQNLGLSNGDTGTGINPASNIIATNNPIGTTTQVTTRRKLVPQAVTEIEVSNASMFPDVPALLKYLKDNKIKMGINWVHVAIAGGVGLGVGYLIKKKN